MKKLLLPFIFCFYFGTMFSQNNYARHNQIDSADHVLVIGSLTFYTTSEGENLDQKAHLYAVKSNGKLKFKYDLPYIQSAWITDLKKAPNGNISMAGCYRPNCDVPDHKVFYAEVDTNGIQQELMTTFVPGALSFLHNVKIFEWVSGDKILATDSALVFSQNGGLSSLVVNIGSVNGVYEDAVKRIGYINHSNAVLTYTNYFSKYDLITGDSITAFPFPYRITKMMKGNNKFYYGLTDSSYVVKFDTLFNIIATSKANQGIHKVMDFDMKQDSLYACTKNSLALLKFDQDLRLVYQHQNPQSLIRFTGIDVTANSVALIANENANNTVKKYPNSLSVLTGLSGNLALRNDASVESVVVVSGYADPFPPNLPFPSPQYTNAYYSLMVKVRNNGLDTLKSVYLNQRPQNYFSFICPYDLNHYLDTTVSIPPGQFAYVTMPTFHDRFIVYPNQQPVNDSTSYSTCVWTSAPNFKGDNDHMNDALCNVTIKIPVMTGIYENSKLNSGIKMFPNPATQTINFVFTETNQNYAGAKLTVSNLLGQVIKTTVLNGKENSIDISEMQTGMYLVEITNDGKPLYQSKLVKH